MDKQGKIFIVSGPSGVGKDTIVDAILKKHKNFSRLVTCTTRAKRDGEKAHTYNFMSEEEFWQKIKFKEFAEWQIVHGNYYGALKSEVKKAFDERKSLIFDIDVKGALAYKKLFPQTIIIFVKYEDLDLLHNRLKKRDRKITQEEIEKRVQTARSELLYEKDFDYSVVNPEGKPEQAIEEVEKIIEKELK